MLWNQDRSFIFIFFVCGLNSHANAYTNKHSGRHEHSHTYQTNRATNWRTTHVTPATPDTFSTQSRVTDTNNVTNMQMNTFTTTPPQHNNAPTLQYSNIATFPHTSQRTNEAPPPPTHQSKQLPHKVTPTRSNPAKRKNTLKTTNNVVKVTKIGATRHRAAFVCWRCDMRSCWSVLLMYWQRLRHFWDCNRLRMPDTMPRRFSRNGLRLLFVRPKSKCC